MASGNRLLKADGTRLIDSAGNRLLAAAESCCFYQLYTCPAPGTAVDKWVRASLWAPGDFVSHGGTTYHIPVGAVSSLCPGTVVTVVEATEEDCENEGEEGTCEVCGPIPDACGFEAAISGLPGENGTGANLVEGPGAPPTCLWFSDIGGINFEVNITCVDGFWVLNVNDVVLGDPFPNTATTIMGPNVTGYPPAGAYGMTFTGGGSYNGQTFTLTLTAVPTGDLRCP